MTYIYKDADGHVLRVADSDVGAHVSLVDDVYVARIDAMNVARELCRAAGRDVVILDRPDAIVTTSRVTATATGIAVDGAEMYRHSIESARKLAWDLAKAADRIESEPDADEVVELAKQLHQGESALDGPESYAAARTVLRHYRLARRTGGDE